MRRIDRDLDRVLTCLRRFMRERGITQKEVQETLGWGRSYVSQLLTRQKRVTFEHVHRILDVIGVEPGDFWGEVYRFGGPYAPRPHAALPASPFGPWGPVTADLRAELDALRRLAEAVVDQLEKKSLITRDDLARAVEKAGRAAGEARV